MARRGGPGPAVPGLLSMDLSVPVRSADGAGRPKIGGSGGTFTRRVWKRTCVWLVSMSTGDLARPQHWLDAVAHPLRLGIVRELAAGPRSIRELALALDVSGEAVRQNLRRLEQSGAVGAMAPVPTGRGRSPVRYRLSNAPATAPRRAAAAGGERAKRMVAVDVEEAPTEWVVVADVPGVLLEDLAVGVRDGVLTIVGVPLERQRLGALRRHGRVASRHVYRVRLPGATGDPDVKLEHGVVTVRVQRGS
jgi:HSP20 family molecular chaperone IbpA